MSAPKPYKFDHLDYVPTRQQLHEKAAAFTEYEFQVRSDVPYMFLVACQKRIVWVETPWESDTEKVMTFSIIQKMMGMLDAHAYAQIVQAWVAVEQAPEGYKMGDPLPTTPPSERPANERDDVVMITSFEKDSDKFGMSRYLVTMRPNGRHYLGPRVNMGEDGHFEGRMWNLLKTK